MSTKIQGGIHQDERGTLIHFNEFDMKPVKRFYVISPSDISMVRAWQAHQKECKWFFCSRGKFLVQTISIDDWGRPSPELPKEKFILSSNEPTILCVPGGNANGFQALELNSLLMVYSDVTVAESTKDDFRFSLSQWEWETAQEK